MGISAHSPGQGIAEVVMDNPPVNALTVAGWFELADAVDARRARPATSASWCCAPRAAASTPASTSRRCRRTEGFDALIGANRGCYAAFAAVYECAVPVIAAVHGFCLGGGIGLVGNADIIVASDDATFGLPEVDRGALGAATHLARLVPQHLMRAMVYTVPHRHRRRAAPPSARCCEVVPRDELRDAALRGRRRDRRQGPARDPRAPRSRSTASTRSTSSAATASSRASPSSSTWPASADEPATRSSTSDEADATSDATSG